MRDFFIIFVLGIFFGNAFIIVVVKVVLVDVRQVAARRPADVRRQALLQILLDVGLYTQLGYKMDPRLREIIPCCQRVHAT